jgi:hypothetical protein
VLVALCGWALCSLGRWRGTDWSAQVYRVNQVSHWGFTIWDPGWYGGTYPLNYSLVYPLAASFLGLWLVAGLSVAVAAFCFDRLAIREFRKRPAGSWYFAASTVIEVAIGQLPTLAAEALALASVLCLAHFCRPGRPPQTGPGPHGRPGRVTPALQLTGGLALGVLAALTSPVVGAFLALALVAWGVADIGRVAPRTAAVELLAGALVFVSAAALPLVFPGPGYFPFGLGDLVVILLICALLAGPPLRAARPVRVAAVLYGVVSIGLFAVPTQMGDNDARFAAYIGVPLVICYTARFVNESATRRSLTGAGLPDPDRLRAPDRLGTTVAASVSAAVALFLVVWHWTPIVEAFDGAANGASSTAAYYQPLIDELDRLSGGQPVRLEIPPTVHHWESAYVAPRFPLARGWERQLDVAYDGLFYRSGSLPAASYRSWLLSNGVSYVALPDAPLDYAATAEAALLRSGAVKGLQPVWRTAQWEMWRVQGGPGLATGPARIRSLTPRSVGVQVAAPGRSVLRLRWSPYWSIAPSAAARACVSRGPGGWTELTSAGPGQLQLTLSVVHADHGHCAVASGVPS